jgi:translation initiation factor IF-3
LRKNKNSQPEASYRINRQITSPTVRLLDADGKQIGVLSLSEAFKLSDEKILDLVEVAPQAQPPVVKLIDYNKFLYQLKKKKQEEKKHTTVSETKQVQFGPFIDDHDLNIKLDRAREFITDGDKVRFVVRFRGREMAKQNLGREVLDKTIQNLSDIAKVEREAKMEGRQMIMVMSKLTVKKDDQSAQPKEETSEPMAQENQTN